MTKTLTEQWREGTLPDGWYYCQCYDEVKKLYCGDGESLELEDPETFAYYFFHREDEKGQVEVLAPVPSYKEWQAELDSNNELLNVQKRLEKKLEIATKALEQYANSSIGSKYHLTGIIACIALKEMEGVK